MPWSRRHGRLRAHFKLLTQMPIAAPVNFSGWQVSRNNTNSKIGRTDDLRTLLRHTACKVRWNVASSYTKGTVRHCLLGNITDNAPREVTGPRRRLGMACFSSEMGHPPKNNQKKLLTRTATDSQGMQHVRRLSWHQERLHHACTDLGTWGCSRLLLGHQFVTLLGSPASASSPHLVHRSATKLNPTSSRMAYGNPFTRLMLPQFFTLSALERPVKGALRGYNP
jgi:hypothetical protein